MAKTKLILISGWLGAAVFFSFVLAPALFGTLHAFNVVNANEIAGTIVTSSLSVVNISGCLISLVLCNFCWPMGDCVEDARAAGLNDCY